MLPPEAVRVAELPGQIVVLPEMLAVIPFETITVTFAVSVQLPIPTTTEYVVLVVGETTMVEFVEPVFHEYVVPPLAVSVVKSPTQMVVLPEMLAVTVEVTVTTTVSVAWPQDVVAVTTYVVVEAGEATGLEIFGLLRPVAGVH
jgi:hypothetical protein